MFRQQSITMHMYTQSTNHKSLTAKCAFMYWCTDTNGLMTRTFGFQRSFSLLCFRQTRLVWAGPRKKFGDLVPGHNNRQTTLFPHFLQLQTTQTYRIILSWSLQDMKIPGLREDVKMRYCTEIRVLLLLPCDQKLSCSVMIRWRSRYAHPLGTWQDAETEGGSGACPSGSNMRTCHWGRRSQEATAQFPRETPASA